MRSTSIYNDMFEKDVLAHLYRGSIAHNLHITEGEEFATDDIDTISVYKYPDHYYLTLESYYHTKEVEETKYDDIDDVSYEIKKMFHLLSQLNPNVTPTLFTREEDFMVLSDAWKHVRKNKELFYSKERIRDVYIGYAISQFKRANSHQEYFGYEGDKRRKLYEQIGYDAKNACHTIRVLRMGKEWLLDGEPQVYRTDDREELIAIKQGKMKLEDFNKLYEQEIKNTELAYEKSKLPEKSNKFDINKLLFEVMTF